MISPENPPGFVVRTEAQKAAFDNGFRLERGIEAGWLRYASATANGEIWLAGASPHGPWFLSVSHPGVAEEMASGAAGMKGPGVKTRLSGSARTSSASRCSPIGTTTVP